SEEDRTNPEASRLGKNVDRDDVPRLLAIRFRNDKPHRFRRNFGRTAFCDQGKGARPLDVKLELQAGVRNPGNKALLINFPQGLAVVPAENAEPNVHRFILAAQAKWAGCLHFRVTTDSIAESCEDCTPGRRMRI